MSVEQGLVFCRMLVPLQDGETRVSTWSMPDPPEGFREETDAEFRARVHRTLSETKD
jgi:hypothetical protein